MTSSGLVIEDFFIIHINNEYVRKGDLDLKQLFRIVSAKKEVLSLQKDIPNKIKEFKNVLQSTIEPVKDIGPHGSDPYDCEFIDHCWKHIPEVSVFDLSRLKSDKKFELYYKGIIEFHHLPEGFSLTSAQELQVKAHLKGNVHIEADNILLGDSVKSVTLTAGVRFNYNSLNNEFLVSPRIGASWKPGGKKDIIFRAALGA